MPKQQNSYDVRILRALDNVIMYHKHFPASPRNKGHRRDLIIKWSIDHRNKIMSGEWTISIINNLEAFNNDPQKARFNT